MPGETFANTQRRNPADAHVYQPSEMTTHTYQYPKVTPVAPPTTAASLPSGASTPPAPGSGSGRRSS